MTQTPFRAAAVATSIQALQASIEVAKGLPFRRRTINDLEAPNGLITFPTLRAGIERIAREAGLTFEWIADDNAIAGGRPRLPKQWDDKFRRIDVSYSRGTSEGWMIRIAGVPHRDRSPTPGAPDESYLIASAKLLGTRYEVAWLACALAAFIDA